MNEVGAVLLVGFVAATIAVWGIVSQRAVARSRATLDVILHSEADGDLIAARKRFIELAKGSGGLAPWADEAQEKSDQTQTIRLVLNEFELISIGIQRGIIDYELYKRWYRSGVIQHWKHAAPFVTALRARTGNDALYHEFEELCR
jgi:Domain of unknown function (DUF4760)